MKYTPHPYNEQGIEFLFRQKVGALWWEMGLGKTATVAGAVTDLMDVGMANRCLVIAPLRVATKSWPDEFKKWDNLQPWPFQIIRGTARQRRTQIMRDVAFHFTNWEQVAWLCEEFKDDWPWDTVILDEASWCKAQSSNRWKALRRTRGKIKRLYELTGSPASNGLKDVWAPVFLMDKGRRLGHSESAFRDRWFYSDRSGKTLIRGAPAEKEIYSRLSDVCYSALAKDHLDMEKLHYNELMVELDGDSYMRYAELERQAFLDLEGGEAIDAFNAAALTSKLLQYSSGGVYTDTETRAWSEVHQHKMKALQEIMDEAAGTPVLVAYNFQHERDRIMRQFPEAVLLGKDDQVIDDWNAGKIPMLIMHPKSGGHGLNLQDGGHTVVWFSLTWSLEQFEQLNARLHRQGQKSPVIIHMLITEGTLDQEVWLRLQGKASVQEALMLAMRRKR